MKTCKLNKKELYNVAYGEGYISPEDWISSRLDFLFKADLSTCTYGFEHESSYYEVWVRNYRKRDWSLLFHDSSARAVLQSLYDFLYF